MVHDFRNKISWSGIIAGLLVGLVVFIASANIGALVTALLPLDLTGTGIAAFIWTIISVLAAAYVAGMVTMYTRPADNKIVTVESTPEEIETTVHRFRKETKLHGFLTGVLIVLATSYFAATGLTAALTGAAKAAVAATTGTAAAAVGAGAGLSNVDDVRNYFSNISRTDVEEAIARQIPELNREQVTATANAVTSEFQRVGSYVQATPVYNLPDVLNKAYVDLKNSLSGQLFADKLKAEGLNQAQAEQVVVTVNNYTAQAEAKAKQAAQEAVEAAKKATVATTLTWLISSALIILASTLGAMSMAHTEDTHEAEKKNTTKKVVHRA